MAILQLFADGENYSYTRASASGDEFDNADGTSEIEIWNRAGISRRVVFTEQHDCTFGEKGAHIAQTVTLQPGFRNRVRHFKIWRYNNANQRVEMTYPDGALGLELAALDKPAL